MGRPFLFVLLALFFVPGSAFAVSENDRLACVKEVPNPYSLAMRQHYVLMCTAKADGLTIKSISANDGACTCHIFGSAKSMKAKSRFMSRCTLGAKPCDFTEVTFETDTDEIVFNWDPVEVFDPKEFNLEFR